MSFHVCYYHIVWTTKQRVPLITPDIEPMLISAIFQKSTALNSHIAAINGTVDHIHIAVSISTQLSIADWVKHIKGYSSHEINTTYPDTPIRFAWQEGYGVLTFGAKNLPFISTYIARQKDHHRDNTIDPYLEHVED